MTRPLTAVVGLLVLVNGTAPHAQRAAHPAVGVESHIVALWRTCNECIGQGHEPVDERARRQHPVGSDRIHQPLLTPLVVCRVPATMGGFK